MKALTKFLISISVLTIIGTLLIYRLWLGYWPPRTPAKIVQKALGVSFINLGIKKYYEQWLPNGDGTLLVIVKTDSASVATILSESKLTFRQLDITNNNEIKMLVKTKLGSIQAGQYYFK
ncbi:hypothetical protein [Runella slithyformis]|uniref:Uncharacterized protein n=1 Tax=Runella slithyformis (strain ATCC 29530 / DSM 19594 / LMG 11500 / NCIMB 11436 / LSU 4) TaxID=761193 RepID=A0A7U4E463_RUNSL|nr:hypothetical protein [Runella slithyformis]AEI47171.1 hypothetical protein Runsl_0730 [Runella slithyformis DSM 19594]